MKRKYDIEVDCANCANKIEDKLRRIDGVNSCNINFMMMKMNVEFDDGFDENEFLVKANKIARTIDSDSKISKN